jgi:ABC-type uncharacterized transport system ATPase subunit
MIKTEKLKKNFGKFIAVKDLDMDISAGEIYGFLGPNGAGKTTLLKSIGGFLKPTSGSITFNDTDLIILIAFSFPEDLSAGFPSNHREFPEVDLRTVRYAKPQLGAMSR